MSEPTEQANAPLPMTAPEDTPVHWLQRFMDNPWLLLMLGFLVPFLSYTVWGWVELLLMKKAELP